MNILLRRPMRHNLTRNWLALAACLLVVAGCSEEKAAEAALFQERLVAFGTLVDVSLRGVDEAAAQRVTHEIETEFNRLHAKWHAWEDSDLTRINQALVRGETITPDRETYRMLEQAKTLSIASGGLFNPAVGKLIALWGFQSDETPHGPPPPTAAIEPLRIPMITMNEVDFADGRVASSDARVQFDVGAFAKGYAVDRAIEIIKKAGIDDAIVNAGGDLRAIGNRGDRNWRVGIRDPRGPGIIASLEIHGDETVFTSGDYERFFMYEGRRYCHIVDPRSGEPAHTSTSVTILHRDAATADAAATALFIAGPDDWPRVARQMGIEAVMLVGEDGVARLSPQMAERIRWEVEPKPPIVVQNP